MKEDEMTVRQAAELLGVSKFRVHAMIRQEQISAEKLHSDVGTPYLVLKRADVERLADERRKIAAGELPARGGTKPRVPTRRAPDEENG